MPSLALAAAPSATATGTRPDTSPEALDAAVRALDPSGWRARPLPEKQQMLRRLRQRLGAVAERWADAAAARKGLPPDAPLRGEEYMSGPWAVMMSAWSLERTLARMQRGTHGAYVRRRVRRRASGALAVRAFPETPLDGLLFNGPRAEVWLAPDATEATLAPSFPDAADAGGAAGHGADGVTAVMGAGNIASIGPLDVLHALFNEGRVAVLKMNPVLDVLGPVLEDAFAEFVDADALRIVYGGAATGAALTAHPRVTHVHVTGSAATFDAIVYGTGPDAAARKAADRPVRPDLRVTGELGGVTPVVVVPGAWTDADLRFHAQHVATQRLHNGGFNCIGAQVLVLPAQWPQADRFLALVRAAVDAAPARPPYYPGAAERVEAVRAHYPGAEALPSGRLVVEADADAAPGTDGAYAFETEFFASPLAVVRLPGATAAAFLDTAVAFCNDRLAGTLGASVLVAPRTERALGPRFEAALERLRYGTVAVNTWPGVGFAIPTIPWGAFPGEPRHAAESGIGTVRNTWGLAATEKAVVRAPFAPFPRSLATGERGLMFYPPWFVSHPAGADVMRHLVAFTARPHPSHVPGLLAGLVRGG